MMSDDLRIVGVAYRLGDLVISIGPPNRHHNILQALNYAGFDAMRLPPQDSGFLLSDGTFADRRRAFDIAVISEQLLPRQLGQYNGPELYSEDLW